MGEVDNIFDQLDRARTSLDELEDRAVRAGELEGDVSKFLNVLENEAVKPAADTTVNLSLGAPTAALSSGISQSIVGAGAAAGRVRNLDDVLPQALINSVPLFKDSDNRCRGFLNVEIASAMKTIT